MNVANEEEIVINENNFNEYFKDVRKNKFEKGQIMAKYSAIAELVDGGEKRQLISLLIDTENKMEATVQIMRKLLHSTEADSYKVLLEMSKDLMSGMSLDDVAKKPYEYNFEMFFYTNPENVPKDDPHWCAISIIDMSEKENFVDFKMLSDEENEKENQKIKNNQ